MAGKVMTRFTLVLVLVSLASCGGGMMGGAARPEGPSPFPWQPPAPTAMLDSDTLPLDAVAPKATTIGEAVKAIKSELVRQDIEGARVCSVPEDDNGFVLVTPLRKIDAKGAYLAGAEAGQAIEFLRRIWKMSKRAVMGDVPRWSLIVFIVTTREVAPKREKTSMDDAEDELYGQCAVQPSPAFRSRMIDRSSALTTLFYEFVQEHLDKDAEFVPQSKGWSAKKHLRIAGLFQKSCTTDAPAAWCETD